MASVGSAASWAVSRPASWCFDYRRLPIMPVLAAATPALAIGHALGRVGCFLVGDDYGRPSDLPWAVAFPQGLPPTAVPVHPTQLYETAALTALAAFLLYFRRQKQSDAFTFGTYLSLAGMCRFVIGVVRVNAVILGPFTVAQLFSLVVTAIGLTLLVVSQRAVTTPATSRK